MKTKILLIIILGLVLVGFTACDEIVLDTSADDIQLSAGHFSIAQTPDEIEYTPEDPDETYEPEEPEEEEDDRIMYIPIPPMPLPPPPPPPPRYRIALTFDDGPSQYTSYILDVLEQHESKATFFVLGNRVKSRADIIRRMAELGNEVAGHSWNHRNFANLGADAIRQQISDTSAAIYYVLGEQPPPFFRPPYGIVNNRIRNVATELGYSIVNWSVDPKDWQNRDADIIYDIVIDRAVDGAIILLHDIRPYTKEAIERIVPSLIEKGFQLVTVSELLDYLFDEVALGGVYTGLRR